MTQPPPSLDDATERHPAEARLRREPWDTLELLFAERNLAETQLRQALDDLERQVAARSAAVQDSEARYRRILEGLDTEYFFYSRLPDGIVQYVSPSIHNVLGYSPAEILGGKFRPYFTDNPINQLLVQGLEEALAGRPPRHREGELRHADGSTRILEYMDVPVFDPNGRVIAIEGVARDVTLRKRAEQELREAKEELEGLVRERTADLQQLNLYLWEEIQRREQAAERLRQQEQELAHVARLSVMGEMVAAIGHEVGQPLHVMATFAAAARKALEADRPDSREKALEWAGKIHEQATRAGEILRRLREFTRLKTDSRQPLDLNTAVQQSLELVAADIGRRRVRVQTQLATGLPATHADRIQIEQVLVNLIRNACEAMEGIAEHERCLLVTTSQQQPDVSAAVCDRGAGMTDEAMQNAFKPFYTTKPTGTGIGLAISRRIIQEHGGRLWATRNDDQGMTFTFTLPSHAAP